MIIKLNNNQFFGFDIIEVDYFYEIRYILLENLEVTKGDIINICKDLISKELYLLFKQVINSLNYFNTNKNEVYNLKIPNKILDFFLTNFYHLDNNNNYIRNER